jgi:hypothetical protein
MARAISTLLRGRKTLLVVSADLSHGLPHDDAVKRDRDTLDRILALDPDWQADQDNRCCGRYPVGVLLELARQHHWRPVLLHYTNSSDATGDRTAVVGYGAVAFYGDEPMQNPIDDRQALTPEQGATLVTLARQTLAGPFWRNGRSGRRFESGGEACRSGASGPLRHLRYPENRQPAARLHRQPVGHVTHGGRRP